jgi:PAP2 superfamily
VSGPVATALRQQITHSSGDTGWSHEYGCPSTHVTLSLTYYLPVAAYLHAHPKVLPAHATAATVAAAAWTAWIAFGRMYSLMHSPLDVIIGALVAAPCVAGAALAGPAVLSWAQSAPLATLAARLALLYGGSLLTYPKPQRDSPSFGDAVAFSGAAAGVLLGWHTAAALYTQPALDVANPQHVVAMAAQIVVGLPVALGARTIGRVAARAVLAPLLGVTPLWMWRLWQPPVHDQSSGRNGTAHGNGDAARGRSNGPDPSAKSPQPRRAMAADGTPQDVAQYSRLLGYVALGFAISDLSQRVFLVLWLRRV